MFLVERIIGLGIFVSILCFVCVLISVEKYNYKKVLFVYILALAIMAFYHVPDETADIYRIYNWLGSEFKYLNFADFLDRYSDSSTFLANLYYWIFSKTGEFRLLPATTAIIVHSCIFYIIAKTSDIYDIKRKYIIISLIFIMSTDCFMSAVSGIRSMLACSLVGFCFFRECSFLRVHPRNERTKNEKIISTYSDACDCFVQPCVLLVFRLGCRSGRRHGSY